MRINESNNYEELRPFFEPKSIAIIGITRKTGPKANNAVENLVNYGYKGKIYPINPNAKEIFGIKAYGSVTEISEPIDLAVISTNRSRVPGHLRECASKGIKCVSIVTQGFTDANDKEGRELFEEIEEIARTTGCRVLGPNSFGSANVYHNFSSAFAWLTMQKNPVGLISQTGGIFNGVSEFRFVGKGIDVGNICNVDFTDCLEYFENDPDVKVIALHIEGMKDVHRFIDAARRISPKKPIVALKTGKSAQAASAVQSHTGSLVGKGEIWEVAMKKAGIISVDTLEELVDVTRSLYALPAMTKPNLCIATFSGGTAIMALDALQNSRLYTGKLPKATYDKIKKLAPDWLSVGNPVDYWPIVMGSESQVQSMGEIVEMLLSDESFGAVLFIQIVLSSPMGQEIKQLLQNLVKKYPGKPLVANLTGPDSFEVIKELQNEGPVIAFPTPERAARALTRLYEYSQYRLNAQ